ncbi:MAG TPA: uroporphyrinogen decarboxylase family protein [Anaerolineales bacterium]|nr:uroporphyrinogen decarboxylase family protein [Anaerolineales bacterium]
MNARERFQAIMRFEPFDRCLEWELGYWGGTVNRWYQEGLPRVHGLPRLPPIADCVFGEAQPWRQAGPFMVDRDVAAFLGHDAGIQRMPIEAYVYPPFEVRILEDHKDMQILQDDQGIVKRMYKDERGMPEFVRHPVQSWADWETLKAERLQPNLAERLPGEWPSLVEAYSHADYPLCLGSFPCGFYGTPRQLMGFEGLSIALYEDRRLVGDMLNYLTDFWISLYDQFLSAYSDRIQIDHAHIWEDMSFFSGPLISPALFRELMLPCYKRLTGFFRDHGIDIILVDTDGNCWELIPLFLEGGVTGVYPFEVAAGMDVVEVREAYPRLQMLGGIDKRPLIAGDRAAIDAELRRVVQIVPQGGYVPYVDHNVPPDISWETFVYYRRRLHSLLTDGSDA